MADTERVICRRTDLADGGVAVKFTIARENPSAALPCFAIAFKGAAYAYVNSCPHRGTELDWQPGEVFEETGLYLICATHGALFAPESGLCVAGPCQGARLQPLAIKVCGNDVVLSDRSANIGHHIATKNVTHERE